MILVFRVAVISSGLGHVNRGIEMWARNLAYSLKQEGIDVTLFKGGGDVNSEIEKVIPCIKRNSWLLGGVNSRVIPFPHRYTAEQISLFFPLLIKLRDKYDIIHLGDPILAKILLKTKNLGLIHSKIVFVNGVGWSYEWCDDFNYVQVLAPHYIEMAKRKGVDTKNWFSIPNSVDIKRFKPLEQNIRKELGIPEGAFVILSVGAFTKRYKRMDWVIEEVAILQEWSSNTYLLIVGESEEESDALLEYGKEILDNKLIFKSGLPDEKMPLIYNSANVFVLGSASEVFGISFLEAMASGLPVIGHKFPVTEWIIGYGGECIDMTKKGELAKILLKYMSKEYRAAKGMKARERVVNRFSNEIVTKEILEMYQYILP